MPNINLIQEQRARAQAEESRTRVAFISFVVVTSASILGYGALLLQADALANKQARLEADLQRLEPTVKRIEENKRVELELQPRVATLEEAAKLTGKWINILDNITTQTPNDTWVTAIRGIGQDPQSPITVSISGLSTRQEHIGEFMQRTQNDPSLDNVQLRFTNEKAVGGGTAIEFELGAEIKDTATAPVMEEAK